MILLLHPRATSPRSRRYPLSILHVAAALDGKEPYAIVDGNVEADPWPSIERIMAESPAEILGVSVMPGPQMVAALPLCRRFRERYPGVPIVWGGYFPSTYPDTALNAPYVDYVVRLQGEETLPELLEAVRGRRAPSSVLGLSYKDADGRVVHNPDRPLRAPDELPWPVYQRVDPAHYLLPTFLGKRTTAHHASIGCPYGCNFCGVIAAYPRRQLMESPARTAAILGDLQRRYGVDAVQFYDNNFYLREEHTRELAERLEPLGLRWWSEGRIDIVLGYAEATLRALQRAGAAMIFFGAESGSDWALAQMNKGIETRQTLALAERLRGIGIVPEFSFVVGNPTDPERDIRECIAFIRKLKRINPAAEIIVQHYVPTPQRDGMYGGVEDRIRFPTTPEEWATPRWYDFTVRTDPRTPWLPPAVKRRIDDFELVVSSRWPTIQDIRLPRWGRALLRGLSAWRYRFGVYDRPVELAWAQRFIDLRKPRSESL